MPAPMSKAPALQPDLQAAMSGVMHYPASFFASAEPTTAYDMISRLPGFTFDAGAAVRGYGGAAGNVLIDGQRPASKNDDLASVLQRIPAAQVDHIDLIRGGAPGVDMQGKAVLANVVRSKSAGSSLMATYTEQWVAQDGRQLPSLQLQASRVLKDGRSLEGSLSGFDSFDDGAGDGSRVTRNATGERVETARDDNKAGGPNVAVTAAYAQPLWGGKLKLTGSGGYQRYFDNEVVQALDATVPDSIERDLQNTETGELGLNYTRSLSKSLSSETVLLQQATGEDFLGRFQLAPAADGDLQRFREQHFQSESIARETLSWSASHRLTLEAGFEGDYNLLHSHTRFDDAGVAQVVPAANVQVDELRGEAFAKASWKATRSLDVELGLRLEASRISAAGDVALSKDLVYPKPRLLLTWSATPADQFRLRLEREVGQLNFSDFVANSSFSTGQVFAGNPNLVPQQAYVVEGAWERRIGKVGAAVLTLRHSQLSDVVDRAPVFSPSGVFDTPANIGSGSKDEVILNTTLPLDRLGVAGGLLKTDATWRRSEVTDPTTHQTRVISGVRAFEGNVVFTDDLPRWRVTWGASVNLGWTQRSFYFNQIERDHLAPNASAFVEYKPRNELALRLEVLELGTDLDREIFSFNGVRGSALSNSLQDRELEFGPVVYLKVRKTI